MAIFEYQFLRNALLASLLSALVCAVIGVIIVEKKLVMMSGGIAHTAYGGVGLGYLCGFVPLAGAFAFAVIAALGIGAVRRHGRRDSDVIIALFWSLGMALGILFTSLMSGYPPELTSYLFGNILSVTRGDLLMMASLTLIVLVVIFSFFEDWKCYLFDEEFALVAGKPVLLMENVLLVLIALSVVVLIRAVGIILVIALLSAPASCAARFTRHLGSRMALAMAFGTFFCLTGLWASYAWDISSGAAIVILSVVVSLILRLTDRAA